MTSSINQTELAKFGELSTQWWDTNGPLKTLHDINPTRLDFIKRYLPLKGARILDLGCGGGILSEALAKEGASVVGVDAEISVITVAENHATLSALDIDYHCSPIESFEQEAFDAIVCMEMLEHVDEVSLVIHHCQRLLKPSGRLFLSTINRTLEAYAKAIIAAEYLLKLLPRQTHDYEKFIMPAELASLVRHEGFTVSGLSGMDYNPLTRTSRLVDSVAVNYLLACQKLSY